MALQSRKLLGGETTFEEAVEEEHNMLQRLTYWQKQFDFMVYLLEQRVEIESIVSYHLNIDRTARCRLTPPDEWIYGTFNICLPVYIDNWTRRPGKRVIIRFPLPYKTGEIYFPGNTDEKLRCEAATYAWIQENCPDVPIPQLWGFAFSDSQIYLIGKLSYLRSIDRYLENEGIPTNIDKDITYSSVEPYLLDLLACHDSRLRYQPNSVKNEVDCRAQMAVLTSMRSVLPRYLRRDLRHGPFFMTLTDLHQSNVFVDNNWHIRYLVDLEWACSLPGQMQHPPWWLTSRGVDQLQGDHLIAFDEIREEFMEVFEKEERLLALPNTDVLPRTSTMKNNWNTGRYWYLKALESVDAVFNLFVYHIHPEFADTSGRNAIFERMNSSYWHVDANDFVATKVAEKEEYDVQLRKEFETVLDQNQKENEKTGW
ncbi:MAG: hypothetical protein Q9217_004184 [Psora testacea]